MAAAADVAASYATSSLLARRGLRKSDAKAAELRSTHRSTIVEDAVRASSDARLAGGRIGTFRGTKTRRAVAQPYAAAAYRLGGLSDAESQELHALERASRAHYELEAAARHELERLLRERGIEGAG